MFWNIFDFHLVSQVVRPLISVSIFRDLVILTSMLRGRIATFPWYSTLVEGQYYSVYRYVHTAVGSVYSAHVRVSNHNS